MLSLGLSACASGPQFRSGAPEQQKPAPISTSGATTTKTPAGAADGNPELRSESKPEFRSEPKAETKVEPKADGKAESKVEPRLDPAKAESEQPAVVVTPQRKLPDHDLWVRIRKGFAMPELRSPLVAEKEKQYLQQTEYLNRMMTRSSRYLFHIVEEVEKRGLPTELALLPFVESAMNPVAMSSARASGLWQFMPATGRVFNLSQNWWVDNRRDVVHSTRAALDYLEKIHKMHGNDWFLALASYNWGEGAVGRAIRKNKARGRPADYLSLDMPIETRHYVPKLMAMKRIIAHADQMGLALPALPNKPYFVTIEKTRPIDLKLAAQFAGMTTDEFVALNPAHNRPVIAASKNNEIKLPADRLDAFVSAVNKHDRSNKTFATWQPYTLKSGETLESVAQRGGVSVAELQKANSLRQAANILPGTHLLAPQAKAANDDRKLEAFVAPRVYEQVNNPAVYHNVGKKETLVSIARRHGISSQQIAALNPKTRFRPGASLLIRGASSQTVLTTEQGQRQVVNHKAILIKREASEDDEVATTSKAQRPAVDSKARAKPAARSRSSRSPIKTTTRGKVAIQSGTKAASNLAMTKAAPIKVASKAAGKIGGAATRKPTRG